MAQRSRANGKRPAWFARDGQINLVIEVSEEEAIRLYFRIIRWQQRKAQVLLSIPTSKLVSDFLPSDGPKDTTLRPSPG